MPEGLWGGVGGDSFWGHVGLGDAQRRGSVSAGLLGIGQGLLSQRPGESWASALGRGIGAAGQLSRQSREDYREAEEADKARKLREYWSDRAGEAETSPEDQEMFRVMAMLPEGQQAAVFAQVYGAKARGRQSAINREARGEDAEAMRLRRLAASRETMQIQDEYTRGREAEARGAAYERSDITRTQDQTNREAMAELNNALSLERAEINREARERFKMDLSSTQAKEMEGQLQLKIQTQGLESLSVNEKAFMDMRARLNGIDRIQADAINPQAYPQETNLTGGDPAGVPGSAGY